MAVLEKRRTKAEIENEDLNYYIAFKIDLNEDKTDKIKEALTKKRNTFASVQTPLNTRLLELTNDIDEIMLKDSLYDEATGNYVPNSGGRKKEAQQAKQFKFKYAKSAAELLCKRGFIWDHELSSIAVKNNVSDKDLYNEISHLFTEGITYKKSVKRELPFSKYNDIESNLKTINKSDLYSFLDLDKNASISDIDKKRESIYSVAQKQGKNSIATATINLCGLVKTAFKSPQSRREYDIYYSCKADVWDKFQMYKSIGITTLSDNILLEISQAMVTKAKMSADEVEVEIDAYMQYFNLVSEVSGNSNGGLDLETCPYEDCGKTYVVKKDTKTCPHCKRTLEIICWNCSTKYLFTQKTTLCPKCKASKKVGEDFQNTVKKFENLSKTSNCDEVSLRYVLNEIKNILPSTLSLSETMIAKKVKELDLEINKKVQELKQKEVIYKKYVQDINNAIGNKELFKAKGLIQKLKSEAPTYNIKDIENTVNTQLLKATQTVELAKRSFLMKNEEQAIEYASKVTELCKDYAEAKQILKNFPPKTPFAFRAQLQRNIVKLSWSTSGNQRAVTYTIIKKIGSKPKNEEDGERLEKDLTIDFYEDSNLVPATDYYYAVYSERGGIKSQIVCIDNPITLFKDVEAIHQEKDENNIIVKWTLPYNVKEIKVKKKTGLVPPSNLNEGEEVDNVTLNGFTDTNISTDSYSYLVVAKYDYKGKEMFSPGIKVTYKKFDFPKPLTEFAIHEVSDSNYIINTSEPINGIISFYYSKDLVNLEYDKIKDQSFFSKECKDLIKLEVFKQSKTEYRFIPNSDKLYWIYPVVGNEQLYLIKSPLLVSTIKGIENPIVSYKGSKVLIEGKVDSKARSIIALLGEKDYPESIDSQVDRRICSLELFNKDNGFYLNLNPGLYYVSLFVEFAVGKNVFYSKLVQLDDVIDTREKISMMYSFDYKLSLNSSYKVKVEFYNNEPLTIPDICLVIGSPKPLYKKDGLKLCTIPGFTLKKKLFKSGYYFSTTLTVEKANKLSDKLCLFFENDRVKNIYLKEVRTLS